MSTATDSQALVAELLERVTRLEDEREIRDLVVRYAESLDYGRNEVWAACFASEGQFDVQLQRPADVLPHGD